MADSFRRRVAERPLGRRIELNDTAGLVHENDAIERHVENRIAARLAVSGVNLRLLARADLLLERRSAVRRLAQLHHASQAGDDEKDVFEDDPCRMLEPAPLARDHDPVHRLRPEVSAQNVIQGDDDGRGNQHAPVPVERQKRQRAEDVEMRFDAAAGEMDQQRAHQHLSGRNRVARGRQARPQQREERRKQTDEAAEHDGGPHVKVRAAGRARPGERRDPQREQDAADPLQRHQSCKQPIGALVNVVLCTRRGARAARMFTEAATSLSVCCNGISHSSSRVRGRRKTGNSRTHSSLCGRGFCGSAARQSTDVRRCHPDARVRQ